MNELSQSYIKAKELDRRIKTSAQLAQQSLYDMCMGLKEMRDGKFYKELGYQNFDEYCEKETEFSRMNAYRYIAIAENLSEDFVTSGLQIGVKKLALLAKLSNEERSEIIDNTDLASTTVKKLEAKIKELHKEAEMDRKEREDAHNSAMRYKELAECRDAEKQKLEDRISDLQKQIKDLESRPIDVAVAEPSDSERRLQENIDKLKEELKSTKAEYEKKLLERAQGDTITDDKEAFKAYLANAADAIKRLCDFVTARKDSANAELFYKKMSALSDMIMINIPDELEVR